MVRFLTMAVLQDREFNRVTYDDLSMIFFDDFFQRFFIVKIIFQKWKKFGFLD